MYVGRYVCEYTALRPLVPLQRGLLIEAVRLPHDGILASHPLVQRALHLGAERELAQAVRLLRRGHEPLLAQTLVLEPLEVVAQLFDFVAAAVARRGGRDGAVADYGKALRITLGGGELADLVS